MQHTLYKHILYTMQVVANRQNIMPKDLLGRSLAYNCFLPRLSNKAYLYENLKRDTTLRKALYSNIATLTKVMQTNKFEYNETEIGELACILFDDSNIDNENEKNMNTLDFLSMIRRLLPFFIIHDSIFIDEYQILESAIGGADMIVIDIAYLRTYCTCMFALDNNPMLLDSNDILAQLTDKHNFILSNSKDSINITLQNYMDKLISFAYNLGLIPIIRIHDREDLALLQTLQNFPHCIYTTYDMIDLLPKESIIFCKNNKDNAILQNKAIDIVIIDN